MNPLRVPVGVPELATGVNNQPPPASLEDLFVSIVASSEDLHLEGNGHNAIDTGLDLSADFTTDIDEDSRPLDFAWDMGADESLPSSKPTIIRWTEVDPYH